MAIGLSHGGSNVYSSPEQSRQLWVATKDGLALVERADGRIAGLEAALRSR